MKPIKEVYPEFAKELEEDGWGCTGNYDPLLQSLGFDILLQVDDNGWQGDARLLLKDNSRYGILIFGWGSCSGCDALQGCRSLEEVEELRNSLLNQIIWKDSAKELVDFMRTRDWETQFCWSSERTQSFVVESIALLERQPVESTPSSDD